MVTATRWPVYDRQESQRPSLRAQLPARMEGSSCRVHRPPPPGRRRPVPGRIFVDGDDDDEGVSYKSTAWWDAGFPAWAVLFSKTLPDGKVTMLKDDGRVVPQRGPDGERIASRTRIIWGTEAWALTDYTMLLEANKSALIIKSSRFVINSHTCA